MHRLAFVVLAVSLLIVGCGKSPEDRMVAHMDAMLTILETNKDAPDKAGDELQKYVEANRSDIEAIKRELDDLEKKMSDEDKRRRHEEMLKKMTPLLMRVRKLMADPKLVGHEKVTKAMGDMFAH